MDYLSLITTSYQYLINTPFANAFTSSFALIVASEIGDKTFFIAAILSMKHSHLVVFVGAIFALIFMTILSAFLGVLLPALLDRRITHFACIGLFVFFGIKLLKDALAMDDDEVNEELIEVETELAKKEDELKLDEEERFGDIELANVGNNTSEDSSKEVQNSLQRRTGKRKLSSAAADLVLTHLIDYRILVSAFVMTFLAEWGDRSQIATIALAAAKEPFGVVLGGIIGHAVCTGMAVIGGKMLASRISEKKVTIIGGVLFLVFAIVAVVTGE